MTGPALAPAPLSPPALAALGGVELALSVEIGGARMSVRDLLALEPGSVVELDRYVSEPVDLIANGRLIARGEIVTVEDRLALKLTDVPGTGGEVRA